MGWRGRWEARATLGPVEAFQFRPATLPSGTYHTSYIQAISVSAGGTASYSYVETGTLPDPIGLSTGGSLSGTPTQTGSFPFTVAATDRNGFIGEAAYTLTINAAATSTSAANAAAQDVDTGVTLSAKVSSSVGTVDDGTVTFTVTDGTNNEVGTAVSNTVTSGSASASFNPYGLAPGSYTITAAYHDSAGNFADSSDTSTLTVTPGPPSTLTLNPGDTTATVGASVTETATVKDALGFQVADGTTVQWSITGSTSGTASISYQDTTTTNGQARVTFSNTTSGTDTVTAVAGTAPNTATGTASVMWTPGSPSTLSLNPGDTTATVGNSVTETATVQDQYGNPVADGTTVNFSVSGITTTSGSSTTTNGQASFACGAILPGTDALTAMAVGGTYPSSAATIAWILPASTHDMTLQIDNFRDPFVMGDVTTQWSGSPTGSVMWDGRDAGFLSLHPSALVVSGRDATLFGTVRLWSGQTLEFRLDVVSNGYFGGTVRLRLSNGYDSGTVRVMTVRVSP